MKSHRCQFELKRLEEIHKTANRDWNSLISYLQLWLPLGSGCASTFNLYQSASHWGWDLEAWIVILAALLTHFGLNFGQVTKLSEVWVFFQCWMFILFCSLACWCSIEPQKVRGESLVVSGKCWGGWRLSWGLALGSDASDVILVLSFFE